MRAIRAYESKAGNLYKTAEECAAEDLTALSKPPGLAAEQIGRNQAMKLVKNRKEVIRLLKDIDAWARRPIPPIGMDDGSSDI